MPFHQSTGMNNPELYKFLKQFYPITEEDYLLIEKSCATKSVKKGTYLTLPGEVQRNLYFVKKGVQMSYYGHEEKQYVIAFTYAPGICAIPESFMLQQPAMYSLKCLSDSELDYITFDTLQHLFDTSHDIERLFRKMTEMVLAGVISRHIELHSLSIEERFRKFTQRSSHLLTLVPHKYIASYLGIDATNFSKLYNSIKI